MFALWWWRYRGYLGLPIMTIARYASGEGQDSDILSSLNSRVMLIAGTDAKTSTHRRPHEVPDPRLHRFSHIIRVRAIPQDWDTELLRQQLESLCNGPSNVDSADNLKNTSREETRTSFNIRSFAPDSRIHGRQEATIDINLLPHQMTDVATKSGGMPLRMEQGVDLMFDMEFLGSPLYTALRTKIQLSTSLRLLDSVDTQQAHSKPLIGTLPISG